LQNRTARGFAQASTATFRFSCHDEKNERPSLAALRARPISDLVKKLLFVRRSKNESSHRVVPLNASGLNALARMFERADELGHTEPEHYLWPACQWGRFDATKPMLKWDTAWRALRDAAGLQGLRFHDLRHTIITELAEMGIADHVLESITGHLSRRMLEHYSHIRIDAKRLALDALDEQRGRVLPEANGGDDHEIETIIETGENLNVTVTSQFGFAGLAASR
jgi:hypothetical protein